MSRDTTQILKACELLGGQAAVARLFSITPSAVSQWCKGVRPVPIEKCPDIEAATRGVVRCEDLRPDFAWAVVRAKPQADLLSDEQPAEAGADHA